MLPIDSIDSNDSAEQNQRVPNDMKQADLMATLTIRNLPEEVRERLRLRAARRGRSMEAEVRSILTKAVSDEEAVLSRQELRGWVDRLYGNDTPTDVVDDLLRERRQEAAKE